jgi:dTDP-4-dehydrorhamnose reductase
MERHGEARRVMKIVLFGRGGQVGRELEQALPSLGRVVAFGREEADLECPDVISGLVRRESPDIVVNAAAYTAVDKAESEPERARRINADAVGVMADEMARRGGWLVHYSTDYVFDGTKSGGYVETDATGPLSVYGATKLEGEQRISASGCRNLIFRTSWVYAAHGSNFIRTILRLAKEREELSVVDDQIGAPTSAARIAAVTAAAIGRLGEREDDRPASGLYHLAASGATSWHGYAEFIVANAQACGLSLRAGPGRIRPIPSSAWPQAARRPANSRLDTTRLQASLGLTLPAWQDDVRRVIGTVLSLEPPS